MKKTAFVLFAATSLLAQAHPGAHAHDGFSFLQGLAHLFTNPNHLVLTLIAGTLGIGLVILRRQRLQRCRHVGKRRTVPERARLSPDQGV